jgi:uncharacterized membrane protein
LAVLLIASAKEEFVETQWAKRFMKSKVKPLLHGLITLVIIVLAGWFIFRASMIILAPMALPPNSVPDLTGQPVVIDNLEFTSTLSQPWRWIYESGDRSCNEIATRCFHLNGNQFAVCSRCTGRELGMGIGMLLMVFKRFKVKWKFIFLLLLIGVLPMAIDAVPQYLGFWESTNLSRVITGFLFGAATVVIIGTLLHEIENPLWEISIKEEIGKPSKV